MMKKYTHYKRQIEQLKGEKENLDRLKNEYKKYLVFFKNKKPKWPILPN